MAGSLIKQIRILNDDNNKIVMGLSNLQETEKKKLIDAFAKSMDRLIEKMSHSEYSQNAQDNNANAFSKALKRIGIVKN